MMIKTIIWAEAGGGGERARECISCYFNSINISMKSYNLTRGFNIYISR